MTSTQLHGSRRSFLMGGAASVAAIGLNRHGIADVLAQETPESQRSRKELKELLEDLGFL